MVSTASFPAILSRAEHVVSARFGAGKQSPHLLGFCQRVGCSLLCNIRRTTTPKGVGNVPGAVYLKPQTKNGPPGVRSGAMS